MKNECTLKLATQLRKLWRAMIGQVLKGYDLNKEKEKPWQNNSAPSENRTDCIKKCEIYLSIALRQVPTITKLFDCFVKAST